MVVVFEFQSPNERSSIGDRAAQEKTEPAASLCHILAGRPREWTSLVPISHWWSGNETTTLRLVSAYRYTWAMSACTG